MRRRLALRRRRCSRRERPRRRAGGFSCTGEMIIESRFEVAGCPGFADTAHGVVGLRRPRLGRLEEDAVCAESRTTRGTPRSRPVRRGRRAARTTARGTRWSRSSPAARSWPHAPSPAPVGCRPGSRWAVGPADPRVELRTGTNGFPTCSRMPSTYAVFRFARQLRDTEFRHRQPSARLRIPIRTRQAPPRVGGEEVRDALETVEAVAGAACLYCRGVPARHPHGRRGVLGVIGSIDGLSPRPPSCHWRGADCPGRDRSFTRGGRLRGSRGTGEPRNASSLLARRGLRP